MTKWRGRAEPTAPHGVALSDSPKSVQPTESRQAANVRQAGNAQPCPISLSVSNVVKTFGGIHALGPMSMDIQAREFVSLVGPSGCGKSTLLEIVGGLQAPDQGEVSIDGEISISPRDSTAIVFQEASTLPWRNVVDNVAFALEVRRVPRSERTSRAKEMIDLVGLSGFERHYPAQLSGGMRQRVAIARSLTLSPRLILADEPFGALDEQTRLVLGSELLAVVERVECAVLFITHSIQEAVLLSDRVLVMSSRPGRIMGEFSIPLARPRGPEVLGTPQVAEQVDSIWAILKEQATIAMKAGSDD